MPAVEIVGEIWANAECIVDARVNLLKNDGRVEFGVQLPVSTALCRDKSLLRSVLVHEFCHCFWYHTELWNQLDAGISPTITGDFDHMDEAADRARLADPRDWFGQLDANAFIHKNDDQLATIHERLEELKESPFGMTLPATGLRLRFARPGTPR